MASILHKRKAADPSASDLTVGEIAINTSDGGIFTKTSGGSVVEVGSGGGSADNATTFTTTENNSTDETVYPVFVDGTSGNQGAEVDTGLTYNPSSGLLTTGGLTVAGDVSFDNGTNAGSDILWDASDNSLNLSENVSIKLNDSSGGQYAQMQNGGTGVSIQTFSGGTIKIAAAGGTWIRNGAGEFNIKCNSNASTDIYYANAVKFATTSTGASITGLMSATTIDGAAGDNLSLDFGSVA